MVLNFQAMLSSIILTNTSISEYDFVLDNYILECDFSLDNLCIHESVYTIEMKVHLSISGVVILHIWKYILLNASSN